jgi:Kef-type K+ transport system membrane component KefB
VGIPAAVALLELIALFVVARVLGEVCERFHITALIGEIAAGIVLGPLVFGLLRPAADSDLDPLRLVADLGVFFIVYEAGMEMTFRGVRRTIRESGAAVAAGSFALPFLLGFLVSVGFGLDLRMSLFLGLALSLTALPVSVRLLTDLGWVNTDVGQTIITAGLLCDIAGLVVLAILSNWTTTLEAIDPGFVAEVILKIVVFFLVIFLAERLLAFREGRLAKRIVRGSHGLLSRGAAFSVPLIIVFAASVFAEFLGLHFVIGTFFGTIVVAEHLFPRQEDERLRQAISAVSMGFLAPLFFAYLGLVVAAPSSAQAPLFIVLLLAAVAGKVGGGYTGARFAGFSPWSASVIAAGMNGRGAMELVIALIGLELGIIDTAIFSILALLGLVTTLMTPFLLRWLARVGRGPGQGPPAAVNG